MQPIENTIFWRRAIELLFDQNLSPRLVGHLAYPDSTDVYTIGLGQASDLAVWSFACNQGFIIVSQDADFSDLSAILGAPPKVIWIRRGNCSTRAIEAVLRIHYDAFTRLFENPQSRILALF